MNLEESFQAVFLEIFGKETKMTLEEASKAFAYDISLPKPKKTASGNTVYSIGDYKKYVRDDEIANTEAQPSSGQIKSVTDIKKLYGEINTFLGSKSINSKEVEQSDNVLGSMNVFRCYNVGSCKNVGFSANLTGCEYTFGSVWNDDCSFCLRVQDSKLCSNCYECSWSGKCANCLYCHNCFDLRDCMFCFHLASKQYCIANRQYTKEEYFEAKKLVVEYLLKNGFRMPFFP